jgi:uncharacterized protein YndB with AHSA1/START domain
MNALKLSSPPHAPYTDYEREFGFPAAAVFRAHADPQLYRQWIGPRGLSTRVERLECRRGGSFRFIQQGDDGVEHAFHGVFHTVRENEFILMTFEYEGYPDVVTLEYTRFEELPGGRCRLSGHSVFPTFEARERYV